MPFKQHSKGRRHIPRQRHRVTNWRDYDAALRNRGSLLSGSVREGQGDFVAKIAGKGGGYVLPVKDNQKNLRENIQTAFDEPVFPPGLV